MSTLSHHESSGTSSLIDEGWVSWFCGLNGNHVFCEVEKQFMEDSFNLFGLKQYVAKDFIKVMNTILDQIDLEDADTEELSKAAAFMYGLIHARYIVSANGLSAMRRKFLMKEFGECPRTYCNGQPVLPVGRSDEPRTASYNLFCPRCRDLYNCHPSQRHIDGAFFGSTFPHIFLMTYEDLVPKPPAAVYTPRLFGFKIHPSSSSLPQGEKEMPRWASIEAAPTASTTSNSRQFDIESLHVGRGNELHQLHQQIHHHHQQQQQPQQLPDQKKATAAVIEAVAAGAVAGVASAANYIAAAGDGGNHPGSSSLYDLIHARSAAAAAAAVAVEATSGGRSSASSGGAVATNAAIPTAQGRKVYMSTVPANEDDENEYFSKPGPGEEGENFTPFAVSLLEEHRRYMKRNGGSAAEVYKVVDDKSRIDSRLIKNDQNINATETTTTTSLPQATKLSTATGRKHQMEQQQQQQQQEQQQEETFESEEEKQQSKKSRTV